MLDNCWSQMKRVKILRELYTMRRATKINIENSLSYFVADHVTDNQNQYQYADIDNWLLLAITITNIRQIYQLKPFNFGGFLIFFRHLVSISYIGYNRYLYIGLIHSKIKHIFTILCPTAGPDQVTLNTCLANKKVWQWLVKRFKGFHN